jgi:PAS domain S-box-containing protein
MAAKSKDKNNFKRGSSAGEKKTVVKGNDQLLNIILLDSEKKYKALFDNAPVGISIIDSERNIIEANAAVEKIARITKIGLQKGQHKKRRYIYSDGREMPENELPTIIALTENRPLENIEIGIIDENENTLWVLVSVTPIDNEGKYGVVITQDITDRKNLEIQLKESEGKFKAFFENSLDAILLTSPDGTIFSANPTACRMLVRTEQEICSLGRNGIMDLTDPRLARALKEREENGKFLGELTMIRKNGEKFPVELSTAIFISRDGRQMTSMIVRDITGRKEAEKKLRESENEYRSLFENSLMAISQAQPGGGILRINNAYAALYGYPDTNTMLNEVKENSKALYANPDDRNKVLETLDKDGYMPPTEFELNRRNGEKFWALVTSRKVLDNSGKPVYLQAEHIDITAQKKLEKERYSASLYARTLLEASLDPLVTINVEGKITDVNLATEYVTGIKRKKLIGSDFSDYFTEPEKAREGYRKVFMKGQVKDYPLTMLHISGRTTHVLYNATVFKNEAGDVQGIFAAARDITVQKKMEEDLRRSGELLEELNLHLHEVWENEKSQIAMNMHDDLGQKLTALNMDLAWLKSRIGIQSSVVGNKLKEMSTMIAETIEGIKEISSFLRPSILFDLGLVPAIKSHLNKFEKQSGIRCHFICYPEEFKIDDRLSLILYRILQESMTNIARHSGAGSSEITLTMSASKVEMLISDDGIGINKGKVNSPKSLGIAGIRERAKLVHGKVLVMGIKGSGTTVRVIIPLNRIRKND